MGTKTTQLYIVVVVVVVVERGRDLCGFIQLTVMHSSFHRCRRRRSRSLPSRSVAL